MEEVDEEVKRLAYGVRDSVTKYHGNDINGYMFYTKQQNVKRTLQNSGVTVIATTMGSEIKKDSYYGYIQEIVEINYDTFNVSMFKCKWVENHRGVNVDKYGLTIVDLSNDGYGSEPFILAKLATQVFFVEDPSNSRLHIIVHGKRRIFGVENVIYEEEYNQFDEVPAISIDDQSTTDVISNDVYLRSDHNEGLWIEEPIAT